MRKSKPLAKSRSTKTRAIVQIAGVEETIMALCDDGSVWLLEFTQEVGRRWVRMPDIPPNGETV